MRRVTDSLDPRKVALLSVTAVAVVLAAAWALDLLVLKTPVLTPFGDLPALTPLYAFFVPSVRWTVLLFPLLAGLLACFAPRWADPKRVGRTRFAALLLTAALLLPSGLFLVRDAPAQLGGQLTIYPGEEVYYDSLGIEGIGDFWRGYVERMPRLSLHGKHFPPGHATWIWLLGRIAGQGTLPIALVVLATFAVGTLFAWRALATLGSETTARQSALLLLACPSLLDFACTSMDAVFFAAAMLALWAGLRALAPGGHAPGALLAGLLLLLSTLLSFSALPLGLLLLLHGLFGIRSRGWAPVRQLGWIGLSLGVAALLLRLATGFDLPRCFEVARDLNVRVMTAIIGDSPAALYGKIAFGNLTAFLIGAGLALVPAALLRLATGKPRVDAFAIAALATVGVMSLGGFHQMETERIWLYAMPWLALVAVGAGALSKGALRVFLIAGVSQALLLELLLFTLW
jgi:hypothetical protein